MSGPVRPVVNAVGRRRGSGELSGNERSHARHRVGDEAVLGGVHEALVDELGPGGADLSHLGLPRRGATSPLGDGPSPSSAMARRYSRSLGVARDHRLAKKPASSLALPASTPMRASSTPMAGPGA